MNEVVVVNDNDEVIGTMSRSEAHANGRPHRIAIVYVENDRGEFLVQVRVGGTLDHSVGGHVDPGESYEATAIRELEEELGIKNQKLVLVGKGRSEEFGRKDRNDDGKLEHRVHVFEIFRCKADPKEL